MKMRELRGDDVFMVLAILGKLELKDELVKVFEEGRKSGSGKMTKAEIEARGVKVTAALLQQVLRNIGVVKDDINALLAELTGASVDEIKRLPLKDYTALIIEFTRKPDLREVFTSAASLLTDDPASTS